MTTPSGRISLDDIRNETGATGKVSLNDWFVRQVAKTDSGRISMSSMRGKTCTPGPSSTYPGPYISNDVFTTEPVTNSMVTGWQESASSSSIRVSVGSTLVASSNMSPKPTFIDAAARRYCRGAYQRNDSISGDLQYRIRWVDG